MEEAEDLSSLDLEEGQPAEHDHIGHVTVVRLQGDEPWQANKVLVKFKKMVSGRTGAGRKLVDTERSMGPSRLTQQSCSAYETKGEAC